MSALYSIALSVISFTSLALPTTHTVEPNAKHQSRSPLSILDWDLWLVGAMIRWQKTNRRPSVLDCLRCNLRPSIFDPLCHLRTMRLLVVSIPDHKLLIGVTDIALEGLVNSNIKHLQLGGIASRNVINRGAKWPDCFRCKRPQMDSELIHNKVRSATSATITERSPNCLDPFPKGGIIDPRLLLAGVQLSMGYSIFKGGSRQQQWRQKEAMTMTAVTCYWIY